MAVLAHLARDQAAAVVEGQPVLAAQPMVLQAMVVAAVRERLHLFQVALLHIQVAVAALAQALAQAAVLAVVALVRIRASAATVRLIRVAAVAAVFRRPASLAGPAAPASS